MILIFFCYMFAFIIHEYTHEYYLYKFNLSDNKNADITYIYDKNIHKYIHPFQKISIYSLFLLFFFKSISWSKELNINLKYYKYFKKKIILVYFMGPLSNIIVSIISLVILKYLNFFISNNFFNECILLFSAVNFYSACINLLPFPGLDGWNIIKYIFFFSKNNDKQNYFTYLLLFLGIFNIFLLKIFNFLYEFLFNFMKIGAY